MAIIDVHQVTKVFGPDPESVLPLLNSKVSKEQIYRETKHTVGSTKSAFPYNLVKFLSLWGCPAAGSQHLSGCSTG